MAAEELTAPQERHFHILWEDILGHGRQKEELRRLMARRKLPHALLLSGPEGVGKKLLGRVLDRFAALYGLLQAGDESEVVRCYDNHLLWREGMHRYSDKDGEFEAEFVSVAPDGRLTLRDADGRERSYYFKEVKHVLKS